MAIAGRFLATRKHYMFCLVMAAIECLFTPFGTVLGVFTIVVLMRDSVKQSFATSRSSALCAEVPLPEIVEVLPHVNASLNALATVLLMVGYVQIKRRQRNRPQMDNAGLLRRVGRFSGLLFDLSLQHPRR